MAPGVRHATLHVHLVEGFSVLTIACLQTVDLMQVKILVGQIQQWIVRNRIFFTFQQFVICNLLVGYVVTCAYILLFCSPYWIPNGRASWSDNPAQPDDEVPGRRARDTGPPEFLLPGCNNVWIVCSEWCLWFHVPGRSKGWSWERDQKHSLERHCEPPSKVSSMSRFLSEVFIHTSCIYNEIGLWTQEWHCQVWVCDDAEEQVGGAWKDEGSQPGWER